MRRFQLCGASSLPASQSDVCSDSDYLKVGLDSSCQSVSEWLQALHLLNTVTS